MYQNSGLPTSVANKIASFRQLIDSRHSSAKSNPRPDGNTHLLEERRFVHFHPQTPDLVLESKFSSGRGTLFHTGGNRPKRFVVRFAHKTIVQDSSANVCCDDTRRRITGALQRFRRSEGTATADESGKQDREQDNRRASHRRRRARIHTERRSLSSLRLGVSPRDWRQSVTLVS